MRRVRFPNLNGLRFIAATMVIVGHVDELLRSHGVLPNPQPQAFFLLGKLGVTLFFVLSGFLITYLLLAEKREAGEISVGRFYLRRILRIWPVYYLIVVLSLGVLPRFPLLFPPSRAAVAPASSFAARAVLFLAGLPNLALAAHPGPPFLSQTWSIGVEEQFYLLWPHLLRTAGRVGRALVWVILGYNGLRACLVIVRRCDPGPSADLLSRFWGSFNVDCMAIGGLAAYALVECESAVQRLFRPAMQYIALSAVIIGAASGRAIPYVFYQVYAALFAVIILNAAANPASVLKLERPVLDYLGRISYGLYMYHPFAIAIAIVAVGRRATAGRPAAIFVSAFGLTCLLAFASYELLEKPFLRLKLRYSVLVSGETACEVPAIGGS